MAHIRVSILVTEAPQFPIRDDLGSGNGMRPIPQWQLAPIAPGHTAWDKFEVDPATMNILARLRHVFSRPLASHLTTTDLHDLTCFVIHKLLLLPELSTEDSQPSAISDCLRCAMALYMLMIHGTTYYSHVDFANKIRARLKCRLEPMENTEFLSSSLGVWVVSVAMAAAIGTAYHQFFVDRVCVSARRLDLCTWDDVRVHLEDVLLVRRQHEGLLREPWEEVLESLAKQPW